MSPDQQRTDQFAGKKALVMGLGLHGGGVETARYLVRHGAKVVCTDLRDEGILKNSIDALHGLDIRFVLGRHDERDFDEADIIVKNPAVPIDSKFLVGRHNLESDISLFLKSCQSPVIAVTGSKGKSTTVAALHHVLLREHPHARIGGNIKVSPLAFVDELTGGEPVVLELSSWQLADLRACKLLNPTIACITNLLHDHQNRYASFAEYEEDKKVIFENSKPGDWCVFPDDEYGRRWRDASGGNAVLVGQNGFSDDDTPRAWLDKDGRGWFDGEDGVEQLLPGKLYIPGLPFRLNSLFAAVMARLWGCEPAMIYDALANFQGLCYRMECFLEADGIRFYDDTTSTIPEAASASVRSLNCPIILIAGGADKSLDFSTFDEASAIPKRILMLAGSATDSWLGRLKRLGVAVEGPFASMEAVVERALELAERGDALLLSPGAASFGLFRHEFERGAKFKSVCRAKMG